MHLHIIPTFINTWIYVYFQTKIHSRSHANIKSNPEIYCYPAKKIQTYRHVHIFTHQGTNSSSSFCNSSLATVSSIPALVILLFWAMATRLAAILWRIIVCSMEKKITVVETKIRPENQRIVIHYRNEVKDERRNEQGSKSSNERSWKTDLFKPLILILQAKREESIFFLLFLFIIYLKEQIRKK